MCEAGSVVCKYSRDNGMKANAGLHFVGTLNWVTMRKAERMVR